VALGAFIGSQPIFGCHTPLVLLFCVWFRLDAALAWLASNVSNPFFAPFLLTAEWQIGTRLATGKLPSPEAMQEAGVTSLSGVAGYTFLGAPVVGLALALAGGFVTFGALHLKRGLAPEKRAEPYRLPATAPSWIRAVEALASRYARDYETSPAARTNFHYVRVKTVSDPIARMLADVAGDADAALGEVLDIGTGRGQLPILLLELGRATCAHGIDWDAAKIREATLAAEAHVGLDGQAKPALVATFEQGDARTAPLREADTVLLIDVLHYFTTDEQDAILRRAASQVRPGGRIVLREADTERGWRSFVTLFEERAFTRLGFNRGERVHFRPARELVRVLGDSGLTCRVEPAWGKTPFSNVLIVGERPA
jgi:SAM-dependent methyltransferase